MGDLAEDAHGQTRPGEGLTLDDLLGQAKLRAHFADLRPLNSWRSGSDVSLNFMFFGKPPTLCGAI